MRSRTSIGSTGSSYSATIALAAAGVIAATSATASAGKLPVGVSEKGVAQRQLPASSLSTWTGPEASVVINVPANTPTYGEPGDPQNIVSLHDLATLSGITPGPGNSLAVYGIGFDGTISAPSPSYLSEVGMYFDDTTGASPSGIVFRPLPSSNTSNASPQPATTGGLIDLPGNGLDPIALLANNTLRIEYYDDYDDNVGAIDGYINTGTITLDVREFTPPPPPIPPVLLYSASLDVTDPTFNRPFSLSGLSGVGTDVSYDVQPFYVSASGEYTFEQRSGDVDSFLLVYTAFDPLAPLTGLVGLDDDSGDVTGDSLLPVNLVAGTQYYFVNTSYDNDEVGDYDLWGPGTIPGVVSLGLLPEPSTLLFAGVAGVLGLARRRR